MPVIRAVPKQSFDFGDNIRANGGAIMLKVAGPIDVSAYRNLVLQVAVWTSTLESTATIAFQAFADASENGDDAINPTALATVSIGANVGNETVLLDEFATQVGSMISIVMVATEAASQSTNLKANVTVDIIGRA